MPGQVSSSQKQEASGVIGRTDQEKIEGLEQTRRALLSGKQQKLDAIKSKKAELDGRRKTNLRLLQQGFMTAEAYAGDEARMDDEFNEVLRDAQKDIDLAAEFREEIELLKKNPEDGAN